MTRFLENKALIDLQHFRYATKKFDVSKKINNADWDTLEQSLILSPSSYGLQLWKFIVVTNQELKEKLKAASWNQSQVTDCSHYVVFTARKTVTQADIDKLIKTISATRGVPEEKLEMYKNMMAGDILHGPRKDVIPQWTAKQVYIALGNLMTSAATLGIDTCPMEGLDPLAYDAILSLQSTDYFTAVACAVGFRGGDDMTARAKKVRYGANELMDYRK